MEYRQNGMPPAVRPGTDATAEPRLQSAAPAQQKRPPVTAGQRWLLLGALLIGVAFRILGIDACYDWMPAAFWAVALAVYLAFNGRRAWEIRYARLLLCGTVALMALSCFRQTFALPNVLLIPCLLMLFLVYVQENPARQREGVLLPAYFLGWFVKPFSAIGRAFAAAASLGREKRNAVPALIGLLIGLPLMAVVTALLMFADAGMESLVDGLFRGWNVWDTVWTVVSVLAVTLLFHSLFYNAVWGERRRDMPRREADWPPATLGVMTGLLLAVYAAYAAVQFQYLFGGRLPAQLTYSAYAREGFWQLIAVAVINFTLFGLTERYAKKSAAGTVLQALLLAATALLLTSAIWRLLLYIGAYGLTVMRILPLWLMAYLAALTVLCAVRLKRTGLPLLRIAAASLLYWYVALNIPDWQQIIAQYNRLH